MKCQIPHHTGIPGVFLLGQVSCANAPSRGRASSDPGCDCGQVLFRCAISFHCGVGHRCCQCRSLSPYCHSHPAHPHTIHTYIVSCALRVRTGSANSCFAGTTSSAAMSADPLYIWQGKTAEGGRGDVVQYSLADVASHYAELQGVLIYYCGQPSMKSWRRAEKGANPLFLLPHAAHISPLTPAVPALVLLSLRLGPARPHVPRPPWALAPSMRLVEAAQLRRISCSLSRPRRAAALKRGGREEELGYG